MLESRGSGAIHPLSPPPASCHSRSPMPPVFPRLAILTVELSCCGRLVALGAPGLASVERDVSAAVVTLDHALGIVRRNPQVVVVAVRRRNSTVGAASVVGAIETRVQDIQRVQLLWIGNNMGVIPGSLRQVVLLIDAGPVLAGVVGAIHTA